MAAVADSIRLRVTPPVQYVLRLADTCLVHAQRQAEWCGHGPVLEEDIALTNVALDHIGQARALLTLAGELDVRGRDEDALAYGMEWVRHHDRYESHAKAAAGGCCAAKA